MTHRTTAAFWELYRALPKEVRDAADRRYDLLRQNPRHPSVRLKKVGVDRWSARVTDGYRAVAIQRGNNFFWFYIGPHGGYDRVLKS